MKVRYVNSLHYLTVVPFLNLITGYHVHASRQNLYRLTHVPMDYATAWGQTTDQHPHCPIEIKDLHMCIGPLSNIVACKIPPLPSIAVGPILLRNISLGLMQQADD
jgi:hypothetical protein